MTTKLQKNKMKRISELLSQDLSYVFGEKECGPNGIKEEFLKVSVTFLKQLAKDLGFTDYRVNKNPAGIASPGTVTMYGVWNRENGVMFELTQPLTGQHLLYRTIKGLKDFGGGVNQWMAISIFQYQEYEQLCQLLMALNREEAHEYVA